tara:strand:- start:3182 stop:3985 length:804 start_codon:yes stop_codon:yes gene_type:complete
MATNNMNLFEEEESHHFKSRAPLAERIRPRRLDEFIGQEDLIGFGSPLRQLIEGDSNISFILWGPPGSGKTTIARIIARLTACRFHEISAVNAGVADIRKIISFAEKSLKSMGKSSILFIDEINRFNKVQQDSILPYIENGTLRLIGATTENPSFQVIPALRWRSQVFRLNQLRLGEMKKIMRRAMEVSLFDLTIRKADEEALDLIVRHANGDARRALNILETAFAYARSLNKKIVTLSVVEGIVQRASVLYDKGGTEHYDHASAFQ